MRLLAVLLVFLVAPACWAQGKLNSTQPSGSYLDLSATTLKTAQSVYASRPGSPITGQIWIMTDTDCAGVTSATPTQCRWSGAVWQATGGSGSGGSGSPLVTPVAVSSGDTSTSIPYGTTLGSGSTALPSCVITSTGAETQAWASVVKTTTTMTITWSPNAGFTGACTAVLGGAAGPTGPTGPAGSGGSVFTGSTATATTGITGTAAAPILSLSDQSVKSPIRFEITLTASTPVTSVTINNKSAGAKFGIVWFQPASNMTTVAYGSSVVTNTTCPVSQLASAWTEQFLEVAADGSTVYGVGCSSSDPTFITVQNNAGSVVNTNFNTLKMLTGTGITWTLTDLGSGIIGMQPNVGILAPANGGTGIANGTNNTLTYTGNFTLGLTLSGNTALTLPTSGTVCTTVTCAGTVTSSSSPAIHQVALFTTGTDIKGISVGANNTVLKGATGADPSFGALVAADLPSTLSSGTAITNAALTTPAIGAATGTSLLATGIVDGKAPVDVTTGTSATLGGTYRSGYTINEHATAATAVAYTLPTAAAGLQYCVGNGYNGSAANTGVITLNTSASGQFLIWTDGTLSATGGNTTSAGAGGDFACVVGVDSTHWMFRPSQGTWTKH